MKYGVVKKLTQVLLSAALALYVGAAVFMNREMEAYTTPAIFAATALLAVSVAMRLAWLRCPHCHRYISHKHIGDMSCPFCGRKLED